MFGEIKMFNYNMRRQYSLDSVVERGGISLCIQMFVDLRQYETFHSQNGRNNKKTVYKTHAACSDKQKSQYV